MRRPLALAAAAALLISGCASLPRYVEKPHSEALKGPETTSLGRIAAAEDGGKNLSGIRLLTSGEEALGDLIALGRSGHLEEIVGPIVFLLTESASYITGEVFVPDGGFRLTPQVLPRWKFPAGAQTQ